MNFIDDQDEVMCCVGRDYVCIALLVNSPDFGYVPIFTDNPEHNVNSADLREIADKLDELNSK